MIADQILYVFKIGEEDECGLKVMLYNLYVIESTKIDILDV